MKKDFEILKTEFDREKVNLLWSSENYFFSKYLMNNDGSIKMISANDTYLNIKNYTKDNVGMSIADFKPEYEVKKIADGFEKLKKMSDRFDFVSEYTYKNQCTVWKISVVVNFPIMRCMGELVTDFTDGEINGHIVKPVSTIIEDMSSDTVIATKTGEHFRIDMFDENIRQMFPDIKKGAFLDLLFQENIYSMKVQPIMNMCIEKNSVMRYYDIFTNTKFREGISYVVMRPFFHDGVRSIIVNMTFLSYDDFLKITNSADKNINPVAKSCWMGYAVIDCSDKDNISLFDINSVLAGMISQDKISVKAISESAHFKKSLNIKSAVCGTLKYKSSDGKEYSYSLNFVPSMNGNDISYIITTIIPTDEIGMFDGKVFSKLTPREDEIVKLVIKGYTNRYIASKLKISEGTVKKVLYNCYKKLGVQSRIEIIKMIYE
ncbi:MAG: helix-turn-helix transcriptional regulator [Clostridia bacterium]|nr:helix-turn-helix transcriptional regulator [Clostridia bacterium]